MMLYKKEVNNMENFKIVIKYLLLIFKNIFNLKKQLNLIVRLRYK